MARRLQNNFFVEKNPTIVNFPVKNMELQDILPVPEGRRGRRCCSVRWLLRRSQLHTCLACAGATSKYDLIANVVHDGKAGEGTYRAHVHRKAEEIWYEVQVRVWAGQGEVAGVGVAGARRAGARQRLELPRPGCPPLSQDLRVIDILPQMVALSEAYFQVYEKKGVGRP